ncbi:transcription factor MYB17-like [Vitis riparia]|uniref:transcription factor MYB17-like n=1 Tax=Vitis riparia TaxID=96939 RepID=UPI00155A331C|nr:transcription factor MYB17-like [Vitis riparia]
METPQQTSGLETRPWTKEEDQKLFECKSKNRHLSWPEIAMLTELERSRKSMMARPEEQRPRWTEEEDRMLFECKGRNSDLPWPAIAELAGLSRSGKSCRERWKNHLDPKVKRGNFSQEEDETIIRLHSSHENSWAFIATHLPGRTDNAVKNRWNNHLKNKLIGRSTDHQNIPDPQSSTGDQLHATQLFHLNHNINPHASSSSIPSPVSASQEIVNPWSTSELAYPEFPGGYLQSDDETIHHAFGGDYFAFEPTQLFHLNYNIDPNPSSSSIPTPVSASQEIANPWSNFELAYPEFPGGYLPIDRETIHDSLGGNYFEFQPTQLFHLNHNIDPNASSSSIPTPVSASQDISSPWSISEFAYTEFSGGYLPSDDFRGDYSEFEPTQLFHLNHNIDPKASSSSIPTLVSASQEVVNPWSTFELAYPEFPGGYL